jgi:hypothetical protein
MLSLAKLPFKLAGALAEGLAFYAGWSLGSYLAEVAFGDKEFPWPACDSSSANDRKEPLWKRKFSPVSEG